MKKLFLALGLALTALICAPNASAHDHHRSNGYSSPPVVISGHYEVQYRVEWVYIAPRLIGYSETGYPIYSDGYWMQRYVPYRVWVPDNCRPTPRISFHFWF